MQVYNSPFTPSTLRALTIIYWWQRTAASLSPSGDWWVPRCLRLLAQVCLETTQLRSAFSLTSLFPTRDSTSLSQVTLDFSYSIYWEMNREISQLLFTVLSLLIIKRRLRSAWSTQGLCWEWFLGSLMWIRDLLWPFLLTSVCFKRLLTQKWWVVTASVSHSAWEGWNG